MLQMSGSSVSYTGGTSACSKQVIRQYAKALLPQRSAYLPSWNGNAAQKTRENVSRLLFEKDSELSNSRMLPSPIGSIVTHNSKI
jgi:hypothetical protein